MQNTLLTLGALLLAVAALVFGAVTYQHLGATGRALVLLALTAAAAAAPVLFVRRGLTATAEALTGVAVVLGLLDAWAFRRAGLGDGLASTTYAALALGLLAGLTALYAAQLPVRTARIAAVVLAQPIVALLLTRVDADPVPAALALAGLAAVDVLVWLTPQLPRDSRDTAAVMAGVAQAGALVSCAAAVQADSASAAFGLLAVAAVAALAAWGTSTLRRGVLAGAAVVLLCGAALAAVEPTYREMNQPLVLAAAALLLALATNLLPAADRAGALTGALLVSGGAVLAHGEQLLLAVAGPLSWLAHPWALGGLADPRFVTGTSARAAVSTEAASRATPAVLLVLVAAAGTVLVAGLLLDRLRDAAGPAAGLGLLAMIVLPASVGASYPVALAVLVAVTAVLAITALLPFVDRVVLSSRSLAARDVLLLAAVVPALVVAAWSVADEVATLAVLPCLSVLAAVAAARPLLSLRRSTDGAGTSVGTAVGIATSVAILLAGAELAAVGFAGDLLRHQVAGLLVVAPAVAVGLSYLLRDARRLGAEAAAALLAATAVALAHDDVQALSWTLAAAGLLALVVAVRADRRLVGIAGGLLLSASSWVRLVDAGVQAPEPYVLPLATAALVAGHLRRRALGIGSLEAYGSGLTLALVPVLLRSVADDDPTRALLLLLASGVVVLLGAHVPPPRTPADRRRRPRPRRVAPPGAVRRGAAPLVGDRDHGRGTADGGGDVRAAPARRGTAAGRARLLVLKAESGDAAHRRRRPGPARARDLGCRGALDQPDQGGVRRRVVPAGPREAHRAGPSLRSHGARRAGIRLARRHPLSRRRRRLLRPVLPGRLGRGPGHRRRCTRRVAPARSDRRGGLRAGARRRPHGRDGHLPEDRVAGLTTCGPAAALRCRD